MKLLFKVVLAIGINALALSLASRFIDGFLVSTDPIELIKVGLWLGVVNSFLKPLLKIISFPLIILSLGLFTILINTAMLLLIDYLSPALTILGFLPALKAVFFIGLVNFVLSKTFLKH